MHTCFWCHGAGQATRQGSCAVCDGTGLIQCGYPALHLGQPGEPEREENFVADVQLIERWA